MGADSPVATTDGSVPADGLDGDGAPLVAGLDGEDGLVEADGPDPGVTGLGSSVYAGWGTQVGAAPAAPLAQPASSATSANTAGASTPIAAGRRWFHRGLEVGCRAVTRPVCPTNPGTGWA